MQQDSPDTEPMRFLHARGLRFPRRVDILRPRIRKSLREGGYEGREARAVLSSVRAGDRVLELGGGIGFMSTWVAKNRAVEHVHVIEANPHLVPYIREVHAANGITNASVENCLLGADAGTAPFYVRQNILASSLDPDNGGPANEIVEVPILPVNEAIATHRPTVLICDIEGAEADLIPRMDLSGLRAAVIETHPQWIGPAGMNAVFGAFMAAGLAYFARGSANKVVTFRRSWKIK